MVFNSLIQDGVDEDRLIILPLRDFIYDDPAWFAAAQNTVAHIQRDNDKLAIIGHKKDKTTFYLDHFPQWKFIEEPNYYGLNATDIRKDIFENGKWDHTLVTPYVNEFLTKWITEETSADLWSEFSFLKGYHELWEPAPFKPIFVTTDAIVAKTGHVLLIKRKINPGKGKFATPGGFLDPTQFLIDSAVRELKEETKIKRSHEDLKKLITFEKYFDHPLRDGRGRTITHAFLFDMPGGGPLPEVKGGDDAKEALWMPFNDLSLNEEKFYSDHLHIIHTLINRLSGR